MRTVAPSSYGSERLNQKNMIPLVPRYMNGRTFPFDFLVFSLLFNIFFLPISWKKMKISATASGSIVRVSAVSDISGVLTATVSKDTDSKVTGT